MQIPFSKKSLLMLFITGFLCVINSYGQYNWTIYTGDPTFKSLEDTIDKGRIIYHKDAENNMSVAGNRGILFNVTLFAFPSLTGSFAWSQVRVNVGKISFYPHIYTFDEGTSSLSIAILYNISRVSPVRGVRTRPSFTPTSLLQLEKEKMNFTRLKFVSEGFDTDIRLQTANQETELSLSDYDINYNYWLKSNPNQKEVVGLRTFFARPLKSFKLRAYSDKGYLDATIDGRQMAILSDVFVKTVDLYQRLVDPNYVNKVTSTNTNETVVSNTNTVVETTTNKKPAQVRRRRRRPRRRVATTQPQTVSRKVVTTNRRPRTRRVVKPK